MESILASKTTSVTELKRNFAAVLAEAENDPVAVLNHNRPEAYLLSAEYYAHLLNLIEDLEDARSVRDRGEGPFVEVALNDL